MGDHKFWGRGFEISGRSLLESATPNPRLLVAFALQFREPGEELQRGYVAADAEGHRIALPSERERDAVLPCTLTDEDFRDGGLHRIALGRGVHESGDPRRRHRELDLWAGSGG